MVSVEEMKNDLEDTGDILDLDMEIVNSLMYDSLYSKRFFILELEGDEKISEDFYDSFELIKSESDFPSDISSEDCIFVISKSGEDSATIDLVKYAKSKKAYVYVMSSESKSVLALLSDKFIHIKDYDNFEEYGKLFLNTYNHRRHFYFESNEYRLDEPKPLHIGDPAFNISASRVFDNNNSHFTKKRFRKKMKAFILISLALLLIGVLIMATLRFTGIIKPIPVNETDLNYTLF